MCPAGGEGAAAADDDRAGIGKVTVLGLVKFRPLVMVKLPVLVLLLKFDRASSPTLSTKLEFGPFR